MTKNPWHYPRPELAARSFDALMRGPSRALTLFAPRRTGKTEFLTKDLAPHAEKRGHLVVYASFWRAPLAPLAVLLHEFEAALREKSVLARMRGAAAAFSPKIKLSAPLPGARAEAEIDLAALKGKPPADLLLYLGDLMKRLESKSRPALLLLDEIQELARDKDNAPLVASLRTSLDTLDGVRTIFTGSSREGLQAMFSDREAPFFHFGTALNLEPLGDGFVDHLCAMHEKTTQRGLDRAAARAAFAELDGNPYFFRSLIELLVLRADLDLAEALEVLRAQMADRLGYAESWLKLNDLQRAVAAALARGAEKPFSKETRAEIGRMLNAEAPPIDRVQSALRRLASLGVADNWSGAWRLEDPEFGKWALRRDAP
ncbi:MAG: hypothetical protein Tsb0010_10420 [Parvularculaceae bacterium]